MPTVLAHTRPLSSFLKHPCFPCVLQTLCSGTFSVVTFQTVNLNIPTVVPNPPSTLNLQKNHATYNHYQYCQGHKSLALIWHRLKTILSCPNWSHHSQSVDTMAPFSFLRLLSCSFIYTGLLGSIPGGGSQEFLLLVMCLHMPRAPFNTVIGRTITQAICSQRRLSHQQLCFWYVSALY